MAGRGNRKEMNLFLNAKIINKNQMICLTHRTFNLDAVKSMNGM